MKKTYSQHTQEALRLFAGILRSSRIEQQMSAQEVAERAGISRSMLQRIEKADPKCAIGPVFEVAHLLGVNLFDMEPGRLMPHIRQVEKQLALLPQRVRSRNKEVKDDF